MHHHMRLLGTMDLLEGVSSIGSWRVWLSWGYPSSRAFIGAAAQLMLAILLFIYNFFDTIYSLCLVLLAA
jgi:hypothetical protein